MNSDRVIAAPFISGHARILFVDDDPDALGSLLRALKTSLPEACLPDALCDAATSAPKALELLAQHDYSVAVIDLSLDVARGVESGFDLLKAIVATYQNCRVIVLTGHTGNEHGIRALQQGAAHFLPKPADVPLLAALMKDGVSQSQLRRAYRTASQVPQNELAELVVGVSPAIQKVRDAILYAAKTTQSVFIAGETGTGKGLCAQAIHRFGPRQSKNFVRYQPTFGAADMVNSDLFGHARGAFTGASDGRRGLLEEADGGTFFLDEIDELPVETQVVLLGVLQERRFRPIGVTKEIPVDFRLITACNQDVEQSIASGKIRRDFFHRIASAVIQIPPLRERKEDIPALCTCILKRFRERESTHVYELADDALAAMTEWNWPGNIRECEAVVENAAYRAHFGARSIITASDLVIGATGKVVGANAATPANFHDAVEGYKMKLIDDALARNGGSQVQAAKELGLDRSTMRRILGRR